MKRSINKKNPNELQEFDTPKKKKVVKILKRMIIKKSKHP